VLLPGRFLPRSLCSLTLLAVGLTACASSTGGDSVDGGISDAQTCSRDEDCVDDGLFCNGTFVCRNGSCQATQAPSCGDGIHCTVDYCDENLAGCINMPNDELCDEGLACIDGQGCAEPPGCEFDTDCSDDAFICNGVPVCMNAECVSVPLDCDDQDECTEDRCEEGMGGCVNEPYDNMNDPLHCGANCQPCPEPTVQQVNTVAVCDMGVCGLECEVGYWDVDMDMSNGCEVACPSDPLTTPDVPDDLFLDENCDGIDGTAVDGIFVAEDGSNANPGTRAFPVRTITFALAKAQNDGKAFVYVSAGTYNETVNVVEGIGIHGGYLRASGWTRDGTRAVISGPTSGALKATNISATTIVEYLQIESANATTPGTSSHAVVAVDSDGFFPRRMSVLPGDGAAGLQGSNAGSAGDDGGNGVPGPNGYEDDGYWYCAGDTPDPPLYQAGGAACQGGSNAGGNGGRSCKTNGSACAGANGGWGGSPGGGQPGYGSPGGVGGSGLPGSNGSAGTNGPAGSGGTIIGNLWVPNGGGDGGTGQNGGGGGGGAGGGSNHSTGTCNDWGGGGGGGGGGGCGGTGGDGGQGGGASIGFLLVSTSLASEYVEVIAGAGANGGAGRNAGSGGPGGNGASGGVGYDEGRAGGSGAKGGNGGRGGHGGGGAGGWSVCVYGVSGATWSDGGTGALTPGNIGLGGSSSGHSGANGQAHTVYLQ
jgi:hypothetical protein